MGFCTVPTHGVTSNLCSVSSSRPSQEVKRVNRQQRQAVELHVLRTLGVQAFWAIAALLMMAQCLTAAGERISSLTIARAGRGPETCAIQNQGQTLKRQHGASQGVGNSRQTVQPKLKSCVQELLKLLPWRCCPVRCRAQVSRRQEKHQKKKLLRWTFSVEWSPMSFFAHVN